VIDLFLIQWPVPSQGLFVDAWKALEKIHADGRARVIGVSNFLANHLDTLLAATNVNPAVNQIELHPTFQQTVLSAMTSAHGIAVEACSPLGQGADLAAGAVNALAKKHGGDPRADCASLAPRHGQHRDSQVRARAQDAWEPGRGRHIHWPQRDGCRHRWKVARLGADRAEAASTQM